MRPPTPHERDKLLASIAEGVARSLERQGLLVRDAEQASLTLAGQGAYEQVLGSSVAYRIAFGPRAGQKALTLRTLPALDEETPPGQWLARRSGFSVHAGTVCEAHERSKLERLCRYIARPAVANERLSLSPRGQVVYRLKTPYRDGTTHLVLDPVDFLARLAALVPRPRVNLTRFHGVFAPHCQLRSQVTPGKPTPAPECSRPPRASAMTWAQRLKRVFRIEIETCPACGARLQVIACLEQPPVIERVLRHLGLDKLPPCAACQARAPPPAHQALDSPSL